MTDTPIADPFALFADWLHQAEQGEPNDPNAMALATADANGAPSVRMVLLKGLDTEATPARGFVFYTNRDSRKGIELAGNPRVGLLFHWKSLRRQIRIDGSVSAVTDAEADAYFASRPRLSRLGAWASDQSRTLESRAVLEQRLAAADARFPAADIPRPPHWSGFRVRPDEFEFWQDMPFRLHNRTVYRRSGDNWDIGKIYP